MTDLQKEFEATGYTSWINANLYPDGKIYTQEYTEWLEKQVQELRKHDVVGQSEQYFCCKEQIEQRCSEQCLGCFQFQNKD